MARSMQPIAKRCQALGISPSELGYAKKTTKRNPKAQVRRKESEYGKQLKEKQKVKFVYGVLERQFKKYFRMAERRPGRTGENLLSILETRLDNVIFCLGLATTRPEARQMVTHGHIVVDGHKVDIPSFLVAPGMTITLKESSKGLERIKANVENNSFRAVPKWLEYDKANLTAKVVAVPNRDDITLPVEEHLIVEFYSR